MPRVNISFWGVFRDGKIYEVHRSMAAAERARKAWQFGNKRKWSIATVQVIYD